MKDQNLPRLIPESEEEILSGILRDHNLVGYPLPKFSKYINGELNENHLVCCHTNCKYCEENIFQAIQEAKSQLKKFGDGNSLGEKIEILEEKRNLKIKIPNLKDKNHNIKTTNPVEGNRNPKVETTGQG